MWTITDDERRARLGVRHGVALMRGRPAITAQLRAALPAREQELPVSGAR